MRFLTLGLILPEVRIVSHNSQQPFKFKMVLELTVGKLKFLMHYKHFLFMDLSSAALLSK